MRGCSAGTAVWTVHFAFGNRLIDNEQIKMEAGRGIVLDIWKVRSREERGRGGEGGRRGVMERRRATKGDDQRSYEAHIMIVRNEILR